jgi:hypothetical protein
MNIKISKQVSDEIAHKLMVIHDTEDLCEEYGVTKGEIYELYLTLPKDGGEWFIPNHHVKMVVLECRDASNINHAMMVDAMRENEVEEAKIYGKLVAELDKLFVE